MNVKTLTEAICNNAELNQVGFTVIRSSQDEIFVSYQELYTKASQLLGYLQELGIKPGEELLFQIEDSAQFLCLFWACILGGIIPVPCSLGTTNDYRKKLIHIWRTLYSPHLVLERRISSKLEGFIDQNPQIEEKLIWMEDAVEASARFQSGAIYEALEEDIAFIQFSSGSTGDPKGVVLTHGNLIANISGAISRAHLSEKDSFLSWMPLTHDMGLIAMHLTPLYLRINSYLVPTDVFVRRPMIWLSKINEHRVTRTASPNFGFKLMMTAFKPRNAVAWDLSCLRTIFNGAEPISPKLCYIFMDLMDEYGMKRSAIYAVYGLAEASVAVSFPPMDSELITVTVDRRAIDIGEQARFMEEGEAAGLHGLSLVEVGSALDGCEIRISSENEDQLPELRVGYIQIRGQNVTRGYYNNLLATRKLITGDGWVNTGDLGFMHGESLVVTGRAKDIIFVNGRNVYPHDIERVAEDVEGIELGKIAVTSLYDEYLERDRILVFIQYKKPLELFVRHAEEVTRHINRQMGLDMDLVIPVKAIPKTTSGKVQRYSLAESYKHGDYDEIIQQIMKLLEKESECKVKNAPQTELEHRLCEIWKDTLGLTQVGIHDHFFEIGGNSTLLLQMMERIESDYPGVINITDPFSYPTVYELAQFISKSERKLPSSVLFLPDLYKINSETREMGTKRCVFKYELGEACGEKLREVAVKLDTGLEELLLALYMILLAQVAESQIIKMHALIAENQPEAVTLELEELSELYPAIKALQAARSKSEAHDFQLQDMFERHKVISDGSVSSLFLSRDVFDKTDDLLQGYDLIAEVNSLQSAVGVALIFNERFLNKEEVKLIFANYIEMLEHTATYSEISA